MFHVQFGDDSERKGVDWNIGKWIATEIDLENPQIQKEVCTGNRHDSLLTPIRKYRNKLNIESM
jgi:hypothetical protein